LQWSFVKDFLSTGLAELPVHCRKAKLQVSLSPLPQKKAKKIPPTSMDEMDRIVDVKGWRQ
jgi:hypothetical protein